MLLSEIADQVEGDIANVDPDMDINSFSTDTRSIETGAMFVALKGANFDGHDFAEQAVESGAGVVMAEQGARGRLGDLPALFVKDTLVGLGLLAQAWSRQFSLKRIAITGNSGKTTVKEMVAAILKSQSATLATEGNLNNEIGVPLTLLRLDDSYRYGVFELGANHPGEIAWTSSLVEPDVALVTNVTGAHLEGFGSMEGIASAKAEIYAGLGESGIAIVNVDDSFAGYWLAMIEGEYKGKKVIRFSADKPDADIFATDVQVSAEGLCSFNVVVEGRTYPVSLQLPGRHNVSNACAALAVALACGVDIGEAVIALAKVGPVKGRLKSFKSGAGATVIDDSYNANPGSVEVAINVLKELRGKRVLVLGEMAELGSAAEAAHLEAASKARDAGLDVLLVTGQWASGMAGCFGENARAFDSLEDLLECVGSYDEEGTVFLVKGSRSAGMERVVEKLVGPGQ